MQDSLQKMLGVMDLVLMVAVVLQVVDMNYLAKMVKVVDLVTVGVHCYLHSLSQIVVVLVVEEVADHSNHVVVVFHFDQYTVVEVDLRNLEVEVHMALIENSEDLEVVALVVVDIVVVEDIAAGLVVADPVEGDTYSGDNLDDSLEAVVIHVDNSYPVVLDSFLAAVLVEDRVVVVAENSQVDSNLVVDLVNQAAVDLLVVVVVDTIADHLVEEEEDNLDNLAVVEELLHIEH